MKIFSLILVIWLEGACTQTTSPPSDQQMCICLEPFPSLDKTFNKAVHLASANDGSNRIFVVDLAGFVWIVTKGSILSTPFVNITSDVDQSQKEKGLQTIAFHPDFKTNRKIYLFYTAKGTPAENAVSATIVVEEFKVKAHDNNAIDPLSRRQLLKFNGQGVFHFGGKMLFDANGLLYIAVGDTNSIPNGTNHQSQNMSSMIGKILRIDVNRNDSGRPYGIPNDNPFVNGVIPEVYALGMRNPWQCTVDKGDTNGNGKGRVFCADVGYNTEEEINLIEKGNNYGWNVMEGKTVFCPDCARGSPDFTDPIFSYPHGAHGKSVIGGFVYRGCHNLALQGHYIYADFGNDTGLFALKEDVNTGQWTDRRLPYCASCGKRSGIGAIKYPISFGQDEKGEPYLIGTRDASFSGVWKAYVYKVVHPASFKRTC